MQFPYDPPLSSFLCVKSILFGPLLTLQVRELRISEYSWSFALLYHDISAHITPYLVHLLRTAGC